MRLLILVFFLLTLSHNTHAHECRTADLNGDGEVNFADFLLFVDQFGGPAIECPPDSIREVPGLSSIALKGSSLFSFTTRWLDLDDDDKDDVLVVPVYFQDAYGKYLDFPETFPATITVTLSTDNDGDGQPDLPHVYDGNPRTVSYCDGGIFMMLAAIPKEDIQVNPDTDERRGLMSVMVETPSQGSFQVGERVYLYPRPAGG